MVENQEAGVDTMALTFEFYINGMRVAAKLITGFIQRHLMAVL